MRSKIIVAVAVATALAGGILAGPVDAKDGGHGHHRQHDPIFAEGGPIAGSANGISFDSEDNLYIASVFGSTITRIDPDTGEILEQLTAADSVFFPDDVVIDTSDDTLYWTDIALGAIGKKPVGQPAQFLVPPFGLPGANPLVLSDDGSRLFAAGCYQPTASLVEIDPVTGWVDNLAFDSQDRLFVSSASDGGVVEVDVADGSVRTVVPGTFTMPLGIVVMDDTVYTANSAQLLGFDRKSGEQTSVLRSVAGIGPFNFPTLLSEWNGQLVMTSAVFGELVVYDPAVGDPANPTFRTQLALPGDAVEFQGDLIVHETGTGNVLRLDGDDLSSSTVIANVPGGTGLAATRRELYIADGANGTILQPAERGRVLAEPMVVLSDLATPEGIDIAGNKLYVVESGSDSLTEIQMRSGKRRRSGGQLALGGPLSRARASFIGQHTGSGREARWVVNQSRASSAVTCKVPGSSNRCVAPGTTARRLSHRSWAWAFRLRSKTTSSCPPTISRVGAVTTPRRWAARSGRPPRDTTAAMSAPGSVAAHKAAAAPVLAPK